MKTTLRLTALVSVFVATLSFVSCLIDNETGGSNKHNLMLPIGTRDAVSNAKVIQDMRLFTFYSEAGANQYKFRREVYNISRVENVLSATLETGKWYLGLLSAPAGTVLIPPSPTLPMQTAPMYIYAPTIVSGKSSDAAEIYYTNTIIPEIKESVPATADVDVARNVAMVELVIVKATNTFNTLPAATHTIKLHNVPSTISYTGALLPSKDAPDTLATPLQANLKLISSQINPGYLESDTIRFVIPAHKGDYEKADPTDVTTLKMSVSVDLKRSNGTAFTKTKEIPIVAVCNRILQVTITVDDGIEFGTKLLPWNKVAVTEVVGENYSNWLYVKKGSTGNGQSWRDALPTINDAIARVATLKAAGYATLHGILVAGGSDNIYTEGISVPTGTRIFGGWEGVSGTELSASDANAPYTSANRNLTQYKAIVSLAGSTITLPNASSVLDGFIIREAAAANTSVVTVSNATAWINAVEISNNTISSSGKVLNLSNGMATNVLINDNNAGIAITSSGKLINATVVNNGGTSSCTSGTILNSLFWGNGTFVPTGTIQYSAFDFATTPAGTGNVGLNSTNVIWFTETNVTPGPHFNTTTNTAKPYYSALSSRAPMLGRGDQTSFDSNTSAIPSANKTDINGNARHTLGTDIGCYEDGTFEGFKLRWASDRVYVSSKGGYVSDIPLILPDNEAQQIGVSWTVTVQGTLNYCTFGGPSSGSGTGVVVGSVKFTPIADYGTNAERQCGTILISTNLGTYLPDQLVQVWQTPGTSSVWSNGYVGSFHKNNETSERYISGTNSGAWTARIISGLDWIKIDGKGRGADGGVVEDTYGGVVKGTGDIKFRVGMKSTLPEGSAPRYGLIVIQRTGGVAMFFVRQGEEADYLYGPDDYRALGSRGANARKFSPYSLRDPQDRQVNGGVNLNARGGDFTTHPSKIGYFFQRSRTTAYLREVQTSALPNNYETSWSATREVCPTGYRQATFPEWYMSCYQNVAPAPGYDYRVEPGETDSKANFVWGRYADGYYDQQAPELVLSTTDAVGSVPNVAMKGILMVNHYNYAALFFPTAGIMLYNSPTTITNPNYSMIPNTSAMVAANNTHWNDAHIGMSCTSIALSAATQVRCVKESND